MITNILWDLDGTLIDTYPAITHAFGQALNDLGLAVAMNEIDGLARQSLDHCLKTLCSRFSLEMELLEVPFAKIYRAVPPEMQPPFPGVREVCAIIHERGTNVVVTHRQGQSARSLLVAHHLAPYFAGVVSVDQGYARKPSPAMFMAALERFGLERSGTLAVGDRELDIQAGRAAGLRTCLFGQAILSEPADFRLDDYSQLLEWLGAGKSA